MLYQYHFLKQQSAQLFELQEEYRDYLLKLRAMVDDFQKTVEQEPSESFNISEKKKSFVMVNRKPEYLRQSLIRYLKENNLHNELQELTKRNYVQSTKNNGTRGVQRRRTLRKRKEKSEQHLNVVHEIADRIAHDITFAWPLNVHCFHISSHFGPRKIKGRAPGFHYGVDLAALRGTIIKAAASGTVIEAGYAPGFGNTIVIAHTKKYKTRYAHLHAIDVRVGQEVQTGDRIGTVGSTGHAISSRGDPSHLHFEVYVLGKRINPLWVLPKVR